MFQFRRPQSQPNGSDDGQTLVDVPDQSFADRMLRSTLGISMADMARLGQEAQAMVAQFDARMAAIEAAVERIEALLRDRLPK